MPLSDGELIARIREGSQTAFRELYERFAGRVYNTALSYVQNVPDAEEVTQDVFVEVHRSLHAFEQKSSLSTWVYRIAVNKSLDRLRSKARTKRFAFVTHLFDPESNQQRFDQTDFVHPGVRLEQKETAAALFKAIGALPENQKTAFILTRVEQLSQAETASVMNIGIKALESLLQRAKENLKKKLEDFYKSGN